jgi:Tol biopolymer transport system component
VVFTSDRSGYSEIYVSESDGSNAVQLTSLGSSSTGTPHWSPDGQWVAFDSRAKGQPDIYIIGAQGGEPRQLTSGSGANYVPTWSRDGRWIYFTSDRGGSEQIWKVPAQGGQAVQVTQHGGMNALESSDGNSLLYWRAGVVYKTPMAGGEDTRVIDRVSGFCDWAMWDRGLCYLDESAKEGPTISCSDFAGQHLKHLATFKQWLPFVGGARFDVSRDGQAILFARTDSIDNDIMLLDNFR